MDKQHALPDIEPGAIIDALGGNNPVAALCRKADGRPITEAAVSTWRRSGIPDGWLRYLWAVRRKRLSALVLVTPNVPDVSGGRACEPSA